MRVALARGTNMYGMHDTQGGVRGAGGRGWAVAAGCGLVVGVLVGAAAVLVGGRGDGGAGDGGAALAWVLGGEGGVRDEARMVREAVARVVATGDADGLAVLRLMRAKVGVEDVRLLLQAATGNEALRAGVASFVVAWVRSAPASEVAGLPDFSWLWEREAAGVAGEMLALLRRDGLPGLTFDQRMGLVSRSMEVLDRAGLAGKPPAEVEAALVAVAKSGDDAARMGLVAGSVWWLRDEKAAERWLDEVVRGMIARKELGSGSKLDRMVQLRMGGRDGWGRRGSEAPWELERPGPGEGMAVPGPLGGR